MHVSGALDGDAGCDGGGVGNVTFDPLVAGCAREVPAFGETASDFSWREALAEGQAGVMVVEEAA